MWLSTNALSPGKHPALFSGEGKHNICLIHVSVYLYNKINFTYFSSVLHFQLWICTFVEYYALTTLLVLFDCTIEHFNFTKPQTTIQSVIDVNIGQYFWNFFHIFSSEHTCGCMFVLPSSNKCLQHMFRF